MNAHLQSFAVKAGMKKYLRLAKALYTSTWHKMDTYYSLKAFDEPIFRGDKKYSEQDLPKIELKKALGKQKGSSFRITLDLFKEGKDIHEIAEMRSITVGTVSSHLGKWIKSGDLEITELMAAEVVDLLVAEIAKLEWDGLANLKSQLSHDLSYEELRWVLAHIALNNGVNKE